MVLLIPLHGAASITSEDKNAQAYALTVDIELQTSGLAALLAVLDSGTRQSQDSQTPQPPLTAAGTMALVYGWFAIASAIANNSM